MTEKKKNPKWNAYKGKKGKSRGRSTGSEERLKELESRKKHRGSQ